MMSLSLMLVLLLYACETGQKDGVGAVKTLHTSGDERVLNNEDKLEGYTNFLELSNLQDLGIQKPHGVGLEILRVNSISPEYGLLKVLKDGIISEPNSESMDYTLSNAVAGYTFTSDNGRKELMTTNLSLEDVVDYDYKQVFESLEDYGETKAIYDDLIVAETSDWVISKLVIETPSISGTYEYKIYSNGLKNVAVLSSSDSFGRYVLNIRYIISNNIEYYIKSEYPKSATQSGVLSIGNLGVYTKSIPTDLYTEDFIPTLASSLNLPLENFIITDEGSVQETVYDSNKYNLRILSEHGVVVTGELEFTVEDLSLVELNTVVDGVIQDFELKWGRQTTFKSVYEVTTYVKNGTTMVFSRSLKDGIPTKLYFVSNTESDKLIEYQIVRNLGSNYMDYR